MTISTPKFFITGDQPCSYLPDRWAQNLLLDPGWPVDHNTYGQLVQQGFRRSGNHVYRPHCGNCKACVPARVRVQQHQPNRNQKRALRANEDLTVHVRPARFCDEYFDLFRRYLDVRHSQSEMTDTQPEQFSEFLISRWCQTEFLEVRQEKKLMAVAVTDRCLDGLSAVYTFFEPDEPKRHLGRYCVQQQIKLAANRQLPYLYLGYWIADCGNMAYKSEYKPLEVYRFDQWQLLQE
ncbi:MAG: arginyltransferase [Granulosicoccaceae bacterium]